MQIRLFTSRFLLLILLFFLNCQNPFDTRDAEEPINSRSRLEIPSDPEAVLRNLQTAILDKSVTDYMYCLTPREDKFRFVPDPSISEQNPAVFREWNLAAEQNYMNQVRNYTPADSISRLFFDIISTEVFADSAVLRRKYTVILHHTYQGNVPRIAQGEAEFWIFRNEGHWYIQKWVDIGSPSIPSWSSSKAGFGQ